uniref:Uncharacterized protein n=1 Tax=Nelumbo nucifera TaxID=4432 RepID=A0A822Y962_NELNU|nr:TPA_asm: hypothetical protein HUJ06_029569 [Nelumbo nucifera]
MVKSCHMSIGRLARLQQYKVFLNRDDRRVLA